MDDFDDILPGRAGEEKSEAYEAKPRRRSRDVKDGLTLCIYAVTLLAQVLDDGPVRTKVLELAAKAKALAQASKT